MSKEVEIARSVFRDGSVMRTVRLPATVVSGGVEYLYQTTVQSGPYDGYLARYETEGQAVEGHKAVLDRLAPGVLS